MAKETRIWVLIENKDQLIELNKWRVAQGYDRSSTDRIPAYHSTHKTNRWDFVDGPVRDKQPSGCGTYLRDWITWKQFETDYLKVKIMNKREIYEAMFKKWVELNDLKVGDTVKIVKEFESYSPDHEIFFNPAMRSKIGITDTVSRISSTVVGVAGYGWDYRSLEKVEDVPVFYESGNRFKHKDSVYIYMLVTHQNEGSMVNMETGSTWNGFRDLKSTLPAVSKKDFINAFGTDFTKIE